MASLEFSVEPSRRLSFFSGCFGILDVEVWGPFFVGFLVIYSLGSIGGLVASLLGV